MNTAATRLASIDVFRALTMFLMIFVNDLWTLTDIPRWLLHTEAQEDGMGLSDVVFPAFLFIVGLSIPLAIGGRLRKGQSHGLIMEHILLRSLALLIMGFFHVNLEAYSSAAFLPKSVWQILITVCFFLIWLDYPKTISAGRKWFLQGLGIFALIFMAMLYSGGDGTQWMKPGWWGILGLIGWSYLIGATIFLFSKNRQLLLLASLIFFLLFNIAANAGWLSFLDPVKKYVWIVGDGSMPALVMAGVLAAGLQAENRQLFGKLLLAAVVFIALGFLLRPYWGISKILATPSWVMICTGISLFVFAGLIWLVDRKSKAHWFGIIRPAGTSTLTAYLLPYIHYAAYTLIGISLPLFLRTGVVGIIKSLLYALIIIMITGLMEKIRLRLKI